MTKKKTGLFGKLKNKLSKNNQEDEIFEDDLGDHEEDYAIEADGEEVADAEPLYEMEEEYEEIEPQFESLEEEHPHLTEEAQELHEELDAFNISDEPTLTGTFIRDKGSKIKNFLKKKTKTQSKEKGLGQFFQNASWDESISKVFSPASRQTIHKLFITSMVASGTYVTGKTTALGLKNVLVPPPAPEKVSFEIPSSQNFEKGLSSIKTANLFNAAGGDAPISTEPGKPKVVLVEKDCRDAKKISALPISLKSTIVLQDSVKSLASVQVRTNTDLVNVRVGDEVDSMAQVGKIERQRLVLKNLRTGECEYIENEDKIFKRQLIANPINILGAKEGQKLLMKDKDDRISNVGDNFTIKKSLRDELLSDFGNVLTQAKAIPIRKPDGTYEFKITEIEAGGIFSYLGVQDNDIITQIGGKPIKNMNEVMSLLGNLKKFDHMQLTVKRNGLEKSLEYSFTD